MTLNDAEISRYARQLLLDDWDIEAQLRLKNSRVVVVGAGGLGAFCLPILVRAGVGMVHIIDFDHIDDSNLQRQALFFDQDLEQPKAKVACQVLQAHNPFCTLSYSDNQIDKHNAHALLSVHQPDLILDCSDNFLTRDIINQTAITLNIPLLSAAAIGETGQLALFEPNKTGCYACLFGHEAQADEYSCTNSGVLTSTVAIIGSLQANLALKFLGQQINPLSNQLLIWQGQTMRLKTLNFQKNPTCPICQPHSSSK